MTPEELAHVAIYGTAGVVTIIVGFVVRTYGMAWRYAVVTCVIAFFIAFQLQGLPQVGVEAGRARLPTKTGLHAGVENAATGAAYTGASVIKWLGISGGFAGKHVFGADIEHPKNLAYAVGSWVEAKAKELFPGEPARQHEVGQKLAPAAHA